MNNSNARAVRYLGASAGSAVVALALLACDDVIAKDTPNPSAAPSALAPIPPTTAIGPLTGTPVSPQASTCPADEPAAGSPCALSSFTCEYGPSPDPSCNRQYLCTELGSGTLFWTQRIDTECHFTQCPKAGITSALDGTPCALPQPDAGGPSAADELVCPMTDGVCACTTGVDGAHAHARRWVCVKPPAACPTARPLAGQLCPLNADTCDYGACLFRHGVAMSCIDGMWTQATSACADQ